LNEISYNTIANLYNACTIGGSSIIRQLVGINTSANTIQNNTIRNLESKSSNIFTDQNSSVIGIAITATSSSNQTISGNTIYNLSNTNTGAVAVRVYGIYYSGPTSGTNTVYGNFIHSLSLSSTPLTAVLSGIYIVAGATSYYNNIVNLGVGVSTGYIIYGIYESGALNNNNTLYFNTVYIGGSTNAGTLTAAFRSNAATNTRIFRNNIFCNARSRTAGSSKHYGAYLNYSGSTNLTLSNNIYYAPNTGGVMGFGAADKTAVPIITGLDSSSVNTNPNFNSPGNTTNISTTDYVLTAAQTGLHGTGITTDIESLARLNPPTIGAWELITLWKGTTSNDFGTASNWTLNAVPSSGDNITFTSNPSNSCVLDANRTVGNIINEQATYIFDVNGKTLTINGNFDFTNGANINASAASSTLVFAGSAAQSIPASAISSNTVNNLTINNSNGVSMGSELSVTGTLTLTQGNLSAGSYDLTMASGSDISGASSSSFVYTGGTGVLKYLNCAASTFRTFPVGHTNSAAGYTPLVITFNGGHTTDDFSVKAYNVLTNDRTPAGTPFTTTVLKTTWNISETIPGGSDINIQFQWNASDEAAGFDRSNCQMAHYNGSSWDNIGSLSSASGSDPYTFTYNGYTGSFSPFGIGGSGGPLPVTMLFFKAKEENNTGVLNWATATEINNDYFSIEKSNDGINFISIGKINRAGNSHQIIKYSFTDLNLIQGYNYYRLKQVDYDGNFSYSRIEVLNNSAARVNFNTLNLYPVPANDILNVELENNLKGQSVIHIIDRSGVSLLELNLNTDVEHNRVAINLSEFQSGVYFLKCENADGSFSVKRFSILK
jgi:hypothetical protein